MTSSNGLYEGVVVAVLAVVLVAFLVGCASMLIPYGLPHTADDVMATIYIGFMAGSDHITLRSGCGGRGRRSASLFMEAPRTNV